jgi:predicted esterase
LLLRRHVLLRAGLALAPVLVLVAGCSSGSRAVPTTVLANGVRVVPDVRYADGLMADLYLPPGPPQPVRIVGIHGGGFTGGGRSQLSGMATELAAQGYPGMAIQYRLADGGPWFPATELTDPALREAARNAVDDASRAVAWLGSEASTREGMPPGAVVVAGYSAGGITAATLAAEQGAPVAGAVSIAGAVVDPSRISPTGPPLLFVHGALDDVVPIALARRSCAGVGPGRSCVVDELESAGHGLPFDDPDAVVDAVEAFVAAAG